MIPGIPMNDALALGANSDNLYQMFNQFAKPGMKDNDKKVGLQSVIERASRLRIIVNPLLDSWHQRMDRITGSSNIHVKSISRTLVGTGLPSMYEIGLSLHPQLGVPYVPASSVRGAVRAFFTSRKVLGDDLDELHRLFGNEPDESDNRKLRKGIVEFLDMMPVSLPDFELDLVNPHYPDYYQKGAAPRANQNPIPSFFLTMAAGSEYVVRYRVNGEISVDLKRMIEITLTENGLGAKTALGYGRFATYVP